MYGKIFFQYSEQRFSASIDPCLFAFPKLSSFAQRGWMSGEWEMWSSDGSRNTHSLSSNALNQNRQGGIGAWTNQMWTLGNFFSRMCRCHREQNFSLSLPLKQTNTSHPQPRPWTSSAGCSSPPVACDTRFLLILCPSSLIPLLNSHSHNAARPHKSLRLVAFGDCPRPFGSAAPLCPQGML